LSLNKGLIFAFVALTLFALVVIRDVKSEIAGVIVIKGDGSVSDPNAIQRSGNIYSLTGDLYNSPIIVQCNNIILDGKGFTLQGPKGWVSGLCAINLTCTNTTIQNFNIVGFWEVGVLGNYNGNIICNNNITKTDRAISIYASNYIVSGNYLADNDRAIRVVGNSVNIYRNKIVNNANGFSFTNSTANTIIANEIESNTIAVSTDYGGFVLYHNNFIDQTVGHGGSWSATVLSTAYYSQASNVTIPPWDNGYPSGGNFWSDYATRYPNATEIGNSGIGDTTYTIGIECAINSTTVNTYIVEAIDRYPLLTPVNISEAIIELPLLTPGTSPSPSSSSTLSSPSLAPSPSIPEFPTWAAMSLVIGVTLLFVALKKKVDADKAKDRF
jgi:parallel beta-helix repeat protein